MGDNMTEKEYQIEGILVNSEKIPNTKIVKYNIMEKDGTQHDVTSFDNKWDVLLNKNVIMTIIDKPNPKNEKYPYRNIQNVIESLPKGVTAEEQNKLDGYSSSDDFENKKRREITLGQAKNNAIRLISCKLDNVPFSKDVYKETVKNLFEIDEELYEELV